MDIDVLIYNASPGVCFNVYFAFDFNVYQPNFYSVSLLFQKLDNK